LFRGASHANLLESNLAAARIAYRKFGGLRFTEAAHIKDVLALLRVTLNPRDQLAWSRALSWCEGLGTKGASRIAATLAGSDGAFDTSAHKKKRYYSDLVSLLQLTSEIRRAPDDLVAIVSAAVTWYQALLPRLYEDAKRREKDLQTLHLIAEEHESLEELLGVLALDPVDSANAVAQENEDEVLTLSTIHSAKGLEWEVVIIIQMGDGAFPSGYALDHEDAMEEERRLLYVAVTRAKRQLILVVPTLLATWQGRSFLPGCSLLDAIDDLGARVERGRPTRPGAAPRAGSEAAAARMARITGWYRG
jgi:DNA helicase-2/ATP-dependent DNA helicase PcrA